MDNGGAAVAFPDFTRGEWNVTKGYKHAYASPEDENASMEKAKAFTAKLKEQGAKEWAKEAKKKKKEIEINKQKCAGSHSVIKGSPILQAHFFMPSEQQPFPDFIENQKKGITGILIISGQSTSTVSNSIRHAILSKKYTERVKRNWNTQTPHTVSRRLLPSTLRKSDSAC